jgi:hypothetical protein
MTTRGVFMPEQQPMSDVIVLIPGILGSVLVRNNREVWGASVQSVIGNLLTFGRELENLKLKPGILHEDPKDGVSAPCLLPRLHMIPTFWKADGYGGLKNFLIRKFTLTRATNRDPGNFIEFPYDWRLSNQLNAHLLASVVIPSLDRWRRQTQNRQAKLILICHSMGGLLARWFLERLGGRDVTRTLITIGTPYKGSINALDTLVNGSSLGSGPFRISIDELVRGFPSVYQLLPSYPCLDVGDGQLRGICGLELPDTRSADIKEGLAFHTQISAAVEKTPGYETIVIKGIDQPTSQSALLRGGKVVPLRSYMGEDKGGDGTVPRPSSHPPEWESEGASTYVSQRHAMLQSTDSILTQILGMLTGRLGRFMGGARIGVDMPDIVQFGSPVPIEATSQDGDPALPLIVVCHGENGLALGPKMLRPTGDGRYHTTIDALPEGAWRLTVQSATPARPVEPVSDWVLVWNERSLSTMIL